MSSGSQHEPDAQRAASAQEFEESLMRAMEEDPRLSSGAGSRRADNVLDFIQMTGLTTGDPDAAQQGSRPPVGRADDPISFFEYGVRDVDGSGDPVETLYPGLDTAAFHVDTNEIAPESSQTLSELRQIIADLAVDEAAQLQASGDDDETTGEAAPRPAADTATAEPQAPDQPEDEISAGERPSAAQEHAGANRSTRGLETARELLHELSLANEAAAHTETTFAPLSPSQTETPVTDTRPSPAADTPALPHGLPRPRRDVPVGRWAMRLLMLAVVGAIGYGTYWIYTERAQTPRMAYRSAETLMERGQYAQASNAFMGFARRHASHPLKADALFMAGFALQLVPPEPTARAKDTYTDAIALLEDFIDEYPTHEKVPRAETLIGVLYYRTERYLEAINILGDPDRRLRDPGAYLTALRTLGRTYAQLSQINNARSAFMRAASLEENMAPDQDYVELAGLYRGLAENAATAEERRRYLERAVEQWNYALQVPGLLKTRKEDIKLLRDVAASKLKEPMGDTEPAAAGAAFSGSRIRWTNRGNQEGEPRESALTQGDTDSGMPEN